MELLKIHGLKKSFGKKNVLRNLNMSIEKGKIVGLFGPNGAGKTTLMKTIAALLPADGGVITYPGNATRGVESKKTVAFLPDTLIFPDWMKVSDAFLFYEKMYPDYDGEKAALMQEILQLSPQDTIKKLSKGMQERVALAVTFSRKAPLYLLDEPLGGIDPVGRYKVLQSIIATHAQDSSILLSTHLIKDVETVFDSILFLKEGEIVYQQDCETMRQETGKRIEEIYLEVFNGV
jgi:ABC-2 type transport system ATP-binding protein